MSVDVAGELPSRLRQGEVMGVGVDFFRGAGESDYQLFAEGSSEGWLAYLQTPQGFVTYPGEFRLGGGRMVFEVPWSSLGKLSEGSFRSFADWSRRADPVNQFGEDRTPDEGKAPFRR